MSTSTGTAGLGSVNFQIMLKSPPIFVSFSGTSSVNEKGKACLKNRNCFCILSSKKYEIFNVLEGDGGQLSQDHSRRRPPTQPGRLDQPGEVT